MENPSLRVSGSGSNTSRTFIAEAYQEDEYGQRAIDKSTGEQGYVDDERSCFWKYDDNDYVWQSRPFERRQVKRRKGKGIGKGKSPGRFKRIRNEYLDEEQKQDNDWRTEEDSVWWSKKRPFKKERTNFLNAILVLFFRIKNQTRSSSQTKDRVQIRVEEEKKVHILNQVFLPQNRQVKKDMVILGNHSNFTDDSSSSATRGTTAWYGTRHTA